MLKQPETIHLEGKEEEKAFSKIVESFQDMVYNTAISIVQVAEDAEDITQEVFIEVYEKLGKFRGEAMLKTWIYRITLNKALDFERMKKSHKRGGLLRRVFNVVEEDEPVSFTHPGALLDNKEKATVLFAALKKLPPNQRAAFVLHKIEGLSYQEVAAVMETSLNAVESLMLRAKNGLRKLLGNYYESHGY